MVASQRFADRREAGRALAGELTDVREAQPVVFGIPRGGVVIGHEVASELGCPLEVLVVRKLGYPGHEEAAFGALGEDGAIVPEALAHMEPGDPGFEVVQRALEAKRAEVAARVALYRGGRPRRTARDTTAIVVDDGIATGYTFAAGLAIVRGDRPRRLIAAAPVAAAEGAELVARYSDELRLLQPAERGRFFAVSLHYREFGQVSDAEVVELLSGAGGGQGAPPEVS
jgi:putative phosphoribosyl transferase